MFQTSESCIKLHAVAALELLLSEQCVCVCVCVCVSTAPGVCVCVSTAPGVCVCVCPLLRVCVCVCVCVSTAPGVCMCVLGWVKCREHISLLVILCIIMYMTKKKKKIYIYIYRFFQNRYPIMVKCLNIGKNIGKPIYRSLLYFLI